MKNSALLLLVLTLFGCRSPTQEAAKRAEAEKAAAEAEALRPRQEFRFISYFPDLQLLSIQFSDGSRSNFTGVGEPVYMGLISAPSKLAYFTNSIQNHFPAKADP